MKQTNLKGSQIQMVVNDWWRFVQTDFEPESDAECETIVRDGENIIAKYKNTDAAEYARQLVFAHFAVIDKKTGGKKIGTRGL